MLFSLLLLLMLMLLLLARIGSVATCSRNALQDSLQEQQQPNTQSLVEPNHGEWIGGCEGKGQALTLTRGMTR